LGSRDSFFGYLLATKGWNVQDSRISRLSPRHRRLLRPG